MPAAPLVSARALAAVFAGGALGVAARAALILPLADAADPFLVPLVTVGINGAGSLLLGVIVGVLAGRHSTARAFFGTGLMGGFTTYSAFATQTGALFGPSPLAAFALAVVSVVAGLVAAFLGLVIGRRIADVPGEIEPPEQAE